MRLFLKATFKISRAGIRLRANFARSSGRASTMGLKEPVRTSTIIVGRMSIIGKNIDTHTSIVRRVRITGLVIAAGTK
jgi:hypothetical protein